MALSTRELYPNGVSASQELTTGPLPDALPAIASLNLQDLLHTRRVNRGHTSVDGEISRTIARFVTEKAEGEMPDSEFEEVYSTALGQMLGNVALQELGEPVDLNDRLFELYDILEDEHPRTLQLLDRVREESNFADDHKISLNKLCLLVTAVRFKYPI